MKNAKNLKILFIAHSAETAGAEKHLLELVRGLQKRKVICKIILPGQGPLEDELKKSKINYTIVRFGWWTDEIGKSSKNKDNYQVNLEAIFLIINHIEQFMPHIVFTNTLVIPWGAVAALISQRKHIWAIHEFADKEQRLKFNFDYQPSIKIVDFLSDAIIVDSLTVKNHYKKYITPSKINHFYDHVTISKDFATKPVYFHSKNSLKALIIGRIINSKGQFDAVKAVHKLISQGKSIELCIIGPTGSKRYLNEIKDYVKKNNLSRQIHLHDYTPTPLTAIHQADIVLLCSNKEALSRVVIESMFLKKAIIATNTGGTTEQIVDGKTGLLYKPGNIEALTEKIAYLLNNPNIVTRLGQNAYDFSKKTYSEKNHIDSVIKLFSQVIKKSSRYKNLQTLFHAVKRYMVLENINLQTIDQLQNENQYLRESLDTIQSSKFYKWWQKYCEIRDSLFRSSKLKIKK